VGNRELCITECIALAASDHDVPSCCWQMKQGQTKLCGLLYHLNFPVCTVGVNIISTRALFPLACQCYVFAVVTLHRLHVVDDVQLLRLTTAHGFQWLISSCSCYVILQRYYATRNVLYQRPCGILSQKQKKTLLSLFNHSCTAFALSSLCRICRADQKASRY